MIEWYTWIVAGVAAVAGVWCLVEGFVGRKPTDPTVASIAVVEVLLVIQIVIAIVAPFAGNPPVGDAVEFWAYLVTAAIMPPAAVFWALIEPSKWSTVILGTVALAIGVMIVRMQQVWSGLPPFIAA